VSANVQPPWRDKFASGSFHSSQAGYRDWAQALLAVLAVLAPGPMPMPH
jgi:hypothetical protein